MKYAPGIVALVLSGALIALLVIPLQSRTDNTTGLLVEAAGAFAEIFLIVLVIERRHQYRERKKWRELHLLIAHTVQHAFVDVVRLNYIFVVPNSPDHKRMFEFSDISRFSLADLRSQIESFSLSLSPEQQAPIRHRKITELHAPEFPLDCPDRKARGSATSSSDL